MCVNGCCCDRLVNCLLRPPPKVTRFGSISTHPDMDIRSQINLDNQKSFVINCYHDENSLNTLTVCRQMLFMNLILWLRKKQLKTTFFPTHFLTVKTNNGWKQSQQRLFIKNDLIHLFQHDMRKQTYKCNSISTPGWLRFRLKIQKLTSPTQCYQPKATIVKVATKTLQWLDQPPLVTSLWKHTLDVSDIPTYMTKSPS